MVNGEPSAISHQPSAIDHSSWLQLLEPDPVQLFGDLRSEIRRDLIGKRVDHRGLQHLTERWPERINRAIGALHRLESDELKDVE
jgi:hypothetical protein